MTENSGRVTRTAALVFILVGLFSPSRNARSQTSATGEDPALRSRMESFARAREFGDIDVFKTLHSASNLPEVRDSLRAKYARFKKSLPLTPLSSTDPAFRRFVLQYFEGPPDKALEDRMVETFARAYALLDGKDSLRAAFVLLADYHDFPPASVVVSKSEFSFARGDSSQATYYLSEDWELPVTKLRIPKRYI